MPDKEVHQSGDIVRLIDIRKTYITGDLQVPVLKGIHATVKRGEFVGFIGTSGSGKSTLLNILGMLDVPTAGQYFLEETEVSQLTDVEQATIRNRKIGFIFQSFNLFPHLSVEENIEVPMIYGRIAGRIRRKRALDLAQRVGLGHRLGHRPTQLSGGECQRIAIARALSNNPAFILADEPTGNLDEKTSDEIMKLFHELNREQGVTIVMVTHNPALGPHYDKIIRLRDGRIDETLLEWEVKKQEHAVFKEIEEQRDKAEVEINEVTQ
ncbi:MAG: ABC transporter ATP-binding protein [Victivallales bacterium]|jgi:putative ABC transport system ATP-binding protein|nr:ABC transporter ATP-binding protein [Victivallales bacterium]